MNVELEKVKDTLDFSRIVSSAHEEWMKLGEQHYLIDENLLTLLQKTNCEEIDLPSLKWPFDGFLLIFPKTSPVTSVLMGNNRGSLFTLIQHSAGFTTYQQVVMSDKEKISEILKEPMDFPEILNPNNCKNPKKQEEEIKKFSEGGFNEVIRTCVSCLAFMNAKPEHIYTEDVKLPKVKRTKADQRPWIAPRWLGKHFQPKTKLNKHAKTQNPTYTLSAHWRRGHWRNQHFGPKDQNQTKLIWLEPVFVGVNS